MAPARFPHWGASLAPPPKRVRQFVPRANKLFFADNRTAAHHAIARAVMGALAGSNLKGWTFFYETPFDQLPFKFEWKD